MGGNAAVRLGSELTKGLALKETVVSKCLKGASVIWIEGIGIMSLLLSEHYAILNVKSHTVFKVKTQLEGISIVSILSEGDKL